MDEALYEKLETIKNNPVFFPEATEQYMEAEHHDAIPPSVLNPPGILGDIARYYNDTARRPQPLFAVASAIAVASVVLGRHYRTTKNNFTSLYFLLVARSGTGKEQVINVCEDILTAAGLDYVIGPKGYTSEAGVMAALNKKPRHITIIDEFGRRLEEMKNSSNSNSASAITQMMEVYGRCHGVARPRGYAFNGLKPKDQTQCVIKPSLTAVALTTPSALFDNLSTRTIKDGMLNRFIVIVSNQPRTVGRDPDITEMPENIIKWCKDYGSTGGFNLDIGGGENATGSIENAEMEPLIAKELAFNQGCDEMLQVYDETAISRANELEPMGMDDMPGRLKENAMRLALIAALSCRAEEITEEHLGWAIAFVDYCYESFIPRLHKDLSSSPYEADKLLVLKALRDLNKKNGAKYRGTTTAWMRRRKPFSKFKSKELTEILSDLIDAGLVDTRVNNPTPYGAKPPSYIAVKQKKEF